MKDCTLFFSISSSIFFISILSDEKIIFNRQFDNFRHHVNNFVSTIHNSLKENNLELSNLSNIYFTSVPSSQTGIRISLTFLSAIMFFNKKLKVYHTNTLLLQACGDYCLSALSIDSEKTKFFFSIFDNFNSLEGDFKIISKEELNKKKELNKKILLKVDFFDINFLSNFEILKKKGLFKLMKNIEEIDY